MVTTYTDTATQFFAGQARTNSAGAAVDDVTGEDLRLVSSLFGGGIIPEPTDAWQVRQRGAGANMSVDVGSGDADADIAVVEGTAPGQGNYVVRKETGTVNVTVPAADVSNPRIDAVYLVVQDNAYDASSRVLPRVAYRDGTPAGSPSAPGPDANWDAFLLLALVSVPAGDTAITDAQITDSRPTATTRVGAGDTNTFEVDGSTEVASVNLTTSAADVASLNLTIPADWGSWKCMAYATGRSSVGTAAAMSLTIRIDGTDQQEQGAMVLVTNSGESFAVGGRRTGMTTTGSRTIALRAFEATADVVVADIFLYARAVRTS